MTTRRFQFSMQTLLLMVFAAMTVLGVVAYWRQPRLERDIMARIREDFPSERQGEIKRILLTLPSFSNNPRVHRCILHVADGDFDQFQEMVRVAEKDSRDVILRAEYQGSEQTPTYDFRKTFTDAGELPLNE